MPLSRHASLVTVSLMKLFSAPSYAARHFSSVHYITVPSASAELAAQSCASFSHRHPLQQAKQVDQLSDSTIWLCLDMASLRRAEHCAASQMLPTKLSWDILVSSQSSSQMSLQGGVHVSCSWLEVAAGDSSCLFFLCPTQNDLSVPLLEEDLDGSSGVLFPFYDSDTNMLYIVGKVSAFRVSRCCLVLLLVSVVSPTSLRLKS